MSEKKWLCLVAAFLFALLASLSGMLSGLDRLPAKTARIWYLGHCGYAVQTAHKLLIFDYSKHLHRRGEPPWQPPARLGLDTGWLDPAEFEDQDVLVFVSHNHADHYDEVIRTWAKTVRHIHYVFGWDAGSGADIHSLPGPRARLELDGVRILTVNSFHDDVPESAFLVQVDGLTLFHGGDYIGQQSPGGPMRTQADMAYLAAQAGAVDAVFVAAAVIEPNLQVIRGLQPRVIFPMHMAGKEGRYKEFAEKLMQAGVATPVVRPEKSGDCFAYMDGQIKPCPGSAK
jgi:L-ascorbate metabolism protein UlaG (beta-lactamase superfamily)